MGVVFIVEGWSDSDQLFNALEGHKFETIVTNGTKINNRIRSRIDAHVTLHEDEVYILSDPDEAGDHLAQMINREYPSIPRIEVDPDKAKYYRGKGRYKFGIEYCSHKYIRELLGGYLDVI